MCLCVCLCVSKELRGKSPREGENTPTDSTDLLTLLTTGEPLAPHQPRLSDLRRRTNPIVSSMAITIGIVIPTPIIVITHTQIRISMDSGQNQRFAPIKIPMTPQSFHNFLSAAIGGFPVTNGLRLRRKWRDVMDQLRVVLVHAPDVPARTAIVPDSRELARDRQIPGGILPTRRTGRTRHVGTSTFSRTERAS